MKLNETSVNLSSHVLKQFTAVLINMLKFLLEELQIDDANLYANLFDLYNAWNNSRKKMVYIFSIYLHTNLSIYLWHIRTSSV